MEMMKWPAKNRSTMIADQKRKGLPKVPRTLQIPDTTRINTRFAAAKFQNQGQASLNAYILVIALPKMYHSPTVLGPSKIQSQEGKIAYTGLYTILISIIALREGKVSDASFRWQLGRDNMPDPLQGGAYKTLGVEKKDLVLQQMTKQGYLAKVTEAKAAGEETLVTWHIGLRGNLEATNESIAAVHQLIVQTTFHLGK